jgi:hypothetical protein
MWTNENGLYHWRIKDSIGKTSYSVIPAGKARRESF